MPVQIAMVTYKNMLPSRFEIRVSFWNGYTYRKQISQTNMKERVSEASSASGDLDLSVQFPGVEKDAPVMETLISLQRNPSLGLRDLVETLLAATANERVEILREFESQLRDIPNV